MSILDPKPLTAAAANASYAPLTTLALDPEKLMTGTITRDANDAATAASLAWPDGATGAYTATTVSTAFPGAVDAYTVTHVKSGTTKTYTQPAVTRNSNGAITVRPALVVS